MRVAHHDPTQSQADWCTCTRLFQESAFGALPTAMNFPPHRFVTPVVLFFALLANSSHGQANKAAAVQTMRLQVYGLGSYTRPEFGPYSSAGGFGVGGALGFRISRLPRIEPSLDVRYTYATNNDNTQTFKGGGLRVTYNVARFHPYGDFMYGAGNINFKHPGSTYTHDNSYVPMYGGGLDIDLTRTFALRADFQRQRWQLAAGTPSFHPTQASLGLRYQFHFRNRFSPD